MKEIIKIILIYALLGIATAVCIYLLGISL